MVIAFGSGQVGRGEGGGSESEEAKAGECNRVLGVGSACSVAVGEGGVDGPGLSTERGRVAVTIV